MTDPSSMLASPGPQDAAPAQQPAPSRRPTPGLGQAESSFPFRAGAGTPYEQILERLDAARERLQRFDGHLFDPDQFASAASTDVPV